MNRYQWVSIGLIAAALGGLAQRTHSADSTANAEQAIRQLENRSIQATLNRDVAFFENALSEDYLNITAGGEVRTKGQTLAELRSGDLIVQSLRVEGVRVRVYGDTAVMTGIATLRGRKRTRSPSNRRTEGGFSGSGRFTRVFVNTGGRWKIASHQTTPLPGFPRHGQEYDTDSEGQ